MDQDQGRELRELIEFLKANEVAEFDMERPDLKVRLKFAGATAPAVAAGLDLEQLARLVSMMPQGAAAPAVSGHEALAAAALASEPAAPAEEMLHVVKSPIVGTFYDSPSPGAAAFVKVGDEVELGQVLCIVEAMKLMNEIEADIAGEVVKRIAVTGQPVEYGQPLFAVRPR